MENPIVALIDLVLGLYGWVVFIYVIMNLLQHFKVINTDNPVVAKIMRILADLTEPVLKQIRKYIKPYNNIDFAPLVLLIVIWFIQYCIRYYF